MPEQRLRIAYVIDSLGRGGAQTALVNLAAGLTARGHRQLVVSLNNDVCPTVSGALSSAGAEVRVIGKGRLMRLTGLAALYRAIKLFEPQVAMTMLSFSDCLGRVAARLAGVPVIVTSIRSKNVHKSGLELFLDRITAPLAHRFVCNSRDGVDFAVAREGAGRDRATYIANGVRAMEARPEAREALRRELALPDDATLIAAVGRLSREKGCDTLLRAFALVRRGHERAFLAVAGDGPLRADLENLAQSLGLGESVRFLGLRDDIDGLLSAADCLAHPSRQEGMSNVIMEAMASGLPVVATDVGAAGDLIGDLDGGLIVPPDSPQALADALTDMLSDPGRMRETGRRARERMQREFSVEKMVGRYEALFLDEMAARAFTGRGAEKIQNGLGS